MLTARVTRHATEGRRYRFFVQASGYAVAFESILLTRSDDGDGPVYIFVNGVAMYGDREYWEECPDAVGDEWS